MPKKIKRIYLARHQETYWNQEDRIQTHSDHGWTCLTPLGQARARELGNILAQEQIKAIYHSAKVRTRTTAELINTTLCCRLIEDPRLNDCSLGSLDGLTTDEFRRYYPAIYEGREADKFHYRLPDPDPGTGAPAPESMEQARMRCSPLIDEILASDLDSLIVGHRGINRVILYQVLKKTSDPISKEQAAIIEVPNFGVYRLKIEDDEAVVDADFGNGWTPAGFQKKNSSINFKYQNPH
jgi:broad specificity phosphatase PhoE